MKRFKKLGIENDDVLYSNNDISELLKKYYNKNYDKTPHKLNGQILTREQLKKSIELKLTSLENLVTGLEKGKEKAVEKTIGGIGNSGNAQTQTPDEQPEAGVYDIGYLYDEPAEQTTIPENKPQETQEPLTTPPSKSETSQTTPRTTVEGQDIVDYWKENLEASKRKLEQMMKDRQEIARKNSKNPVIPGVVQTQTAEVLITNEGENSDSVPTRSQNPEEIDKEKITNPDYSKTKAEQEDNPTTEENNKSHEIPETQKNNSVNTQEQLPNITAGETSAIPNYPKRPETLGVAVGEIETSLIASRLDLQLPPEIAKESTVPKAEVVGRQTEVVKNPEFKGHFNDYSKHIFHNVIDQKKDILSYGDLKKVLENNPFYNTQIGRIDNVNDEFVLNILASGHGDYGTLWYGDVSQYPLAVSFRNINIKKGKDNLEIYRDGLVEVIKIPLSEARNLSLHKHPEPPSLSPKPKVPAPDNGAKGYDEAIKEQIPNTDYSKTKAEQEDNPTTEEIKSPLPKTPEKTEDIKVGQIYRNVDSGERYRVKIIHDRVQDSLVILEKLEGKINTISLALSYFTERLQPVADRGGKPVWKLVKDVENPTEVKSTQITDINTDLQTDENVLQETKVDETIIQKVEDPTQSSPKVVDVEVLTDEITGNEPTEKQTKNPIAGMETLAKPGGQEAITVEVIPETPEKKKQEPLQEQLPVQNNQDDDGELDDLERQMKILDNVFVILPATLSKMGSVESDFEYFNKPHATGLISIIEENRTRLNSIKANFHTLKYLLENYTDSYDPNTVSDLYDKLHVCIIYINDMMSRISGDRTISEIVSGVKTSLGEIQKMKSELNRHMENLEGEREAVSQKMQAKTD
jgi:hypothetical protein